MEGGVGAFTQELARALKALNPSLYDIHLITNRQARPETPDRRSWRGLGQPVDLGYARLHAQMRHWRWPSVSAVADLVLRYDLDVVNIQYQAAAYDMRSPAINFLPWRLRAVTKTAVTFHDLRVPYLFAKAGRLRPMAVRFMARQAAGVIVTNGEDYTALQADISPQRLRQIPIGSNIAVHPVTAEAVTAVRHQLGLTPDHRLLGYFGFLNESKGADTLLQALHQLDERTHLVFIGGRTGASDPANNSAFFAQLDALIQSLGLEQRVHWTGFLPDAAVSTYLNAADLMVMPYHDGVSLRRGTLMATLAHGRPLITTTPTQPTPELVHGQNVWFTAVQDVPALVQSIRSLAADPGLRQRLGEGAAQTAALFTWDKIAAQTAVFFEELRGRVVSQ
jgi:glycosyltransferase involved in cell wall biosynthesis